MTRIRHKRGDTFLYSAALHQTSKVGPVIDLTDWTITSMIRDASDTLIDTVTVTVTDVAAGEYALQVDDTSGWPVGRLYWDIQYIDAVNVIRSTETFELEIVKDVTYPESA